MCHPLLSPPTAAREKPSLFRTTDLSASKGWAMSRAMSADEQECGSLWSQPQRAKPYLSIKRALSLSGWDLEPWALFCSAVWWWLWGEALRRVSSSLSHLLSVLSKYGWREGYRQSSHSLCSKGQSTFPSQRFGSLNVKSVDLGDWGPHVNRCCNLHGGSLQITSIPNLSSSGTLKVFILSYFYWETV